MMNKKNINCPVRGHKHNLKLEQDPERSDMLIGRCGDRVVYRSPVRHHLVDDTPLESMTVAQLKALPDWDSVPTPRPTGKAKIVEAILKVRALRELPAGPYEYNVPQYKE